MKEKFEEYLHGRFINECNCAGDETSDDFDNWLNELDREQITNYAEIWKIEQEIRELKDKLKALK